MARSVIIGSGASIPPNRVSNAMLARIMDTSDEWIRERSGVETRYFVDAGTATSDLGAAAAAQALENARVRREDVDLVIFATMTPDHYFPGNGGILQAKLGLRPVPCFDIRQQCVGFLYGLQLADAQIRAGMARTVLLVGAEIHSGFMPFTPGQLGVPLRPLGRAAHPRGVGLEHAFPPPARALRRRGGGGGRPGGGRRRAGRDRHRPAHGRQRLREALRARHRLQAPALHGPRAVPPRRPHPGDGRPLRLQGGDHAHDGGGAGGPGAQRDAPRRTSPSS